MIVKRWLLFYIFLFLHIQLSAQEDVKVRDSLFTKVDVMPSFIGGRVEWVKFLQNNLRPNVPIIHGAPSGHFTVMVQFIVDKNGSITDLKSLTNLGYGMEEEVKRIILKAGKWEPARQDGRLVKAYLRQPVIFVVEPNSVNPRTKGREYTFYTEIDNELDFDIYLAKKDDIVCKLEKGTIKKKKKGSYIVNVNEPGRTLLQVFSEQGKLIDELSFEVLPFKEGPAALKQKPDHTSNN